MPNHRNPKYKLTGDERYSSKSPLKMIWLGMRRRCGNPEDPSYHNYGGRGIKVCSRWELFENFVDDMWPRPSGLSIERKNNDKGYSKSNCKWATRTEQCLNRRRFKNNTTGVTGVELKSDGRYIARFSLGNKCYKHGGTFATVVEATEARDNIKELVTSGRDVKHLMKRPARFDSSTGIRGISSHTDGGFLVRKTIKSKRIYFGYYKTLDQAKLALQSGVNLHKEKS